MNREIHYNVPTRLNKAPCATLWECEIDPLCSMIFIQTSNDEEKPVWIRVGYFLEEVYKDELQDATFIDACMKRFKKV